MAISSIVTISQNGNNSSSQFKFELQIVFSSKIWGSVIKSEIYVYLEVFSLRSLFLLPSTVFTSARQTLFTISIQFLSLRRRF